LQQTPLAIIIKELATWKTKLTAMMPIVLRILFIIMMLTSTSNQHSIPQPRPTRLQYELIYNTDETTEETGAIKMWCRDEFAENIPVSEVQFWLNRTSPCDPSLREQNDFDVDEADKYTISFNLIRNLDGVYTCGRRINVTHMQESPRVTLTCKLFSRA
jgi:hypothetical protein